MKASSAPSEVAAGEISPRGGVADRLLRALVFRRLAALREGCLMIEDADGVHNFGSLRYGEAPIRIRVKDARAYLRVAVRGTVGAGEAYMFGWWECEDLSAMVRTFVRNRRLLNGMDSGVTALAMPFLRLYHRLRSNTREGSALNIAAHYDLGNDFYRLWLDPSMTYSCALFEQAEWSLARAQDAKYQQICERIELGPDDHVLEIGTGWGGFALYAAGRFGCKVTTTTISKAQFEFATARVREAGLEDRIELLCRDYRDLKGRYDKVVTIEMFEAVGFKNYPTFFAACDRLLASDGAMLLQTITIAESEFERARRDVDFIQRYIFPGGSLPSISKLANALGEASSLQIKHLQEIGPHYAETLRRWRDNFESQLAAVRKQGFGEVFVRMWRFYLCYCEGGFDERSIGTVQVLLTKGRGI